MKSRSICLAGLLVLAGCGGMTRAVAILPETTDDLARKSEAFRKPAPPPAGAMTRTP